MAQAALICVFVWWFLLKLDVFFLSWQCLNRPIIAAPVIGLLLGDFTTGIIMGASLEAIFMGISAIGGTVPADGLTAAIISVAYVVVAGGDIETGIALALPIGVLMAQTSFMFMPVFAAMAAYWERLATRASPRVFLIQNLIFTLFVMPLSGAIILYFSVAFGVEGLQAGIAALPYWFTVGLAATSAMMVAVGFAILCSMIWSGKLAVFFFVGFVMSMVLGMDALSVAIIGTAIAVSVFFADKDFIDFKNQLSKLKPQDSVSGEEDFF